MTSLVEVFQRAVGVEAQVELVAPAELVAGLAQGIVADLCARMTFGQVGRMGGNLVGDDTRTHVFTVGQTQVFLRGDVAQHGRTQPADLCGTDGRGDVVVTRGDVGHQRAEGVERRVVAVADLALHVLADFVQGHVSRTFDEGLHVLRPRTGHQLAHRVEFGKLCLVVGVGDTARTQPVAQ